MPEPTTLAVHQDITWAPAPNTLTVTRGTNPADTVAVTSVILLVRDGAGDVLLTHVADRGWDLPGGHLEEGETPVQAAVRELAEETGLAMAPESLRVHGWQSLHVAAPKPDGYRYPHPDSQQIVYSATLNEVRPPVHPAPGTECTAAAWRDPVQAAEQLADRTWQPYVAEDIALNPGLG